MALDMCYSGRLKGAVYLSRDAVLAASTERVRIARRTTSIRRYDLCQQVLVSYGPVCIRLQSTRCSGSV